MVVSTETSLVVRLATWLVFNAATAAVDSWTICPVVVALRFAMSVVVKAAACVADRPLTCVVVRPVLTWLVVKLAT